VTRILVSEGATVQFPLVNHASEIGWDVVSTADATRKRGGEAGLYFYDELRDALLRLNPGVITPDNVQSVIQRMESAPATIAGNRETLEWMRGNHTILDESENRDRNVILIDFENADRNVYQVTWEWTCRIGQRKSNRADIVFLINGLPVAIVENKNPRHADALERAITQFRRYEIETPELLVTPQLFNVTHLLDYHYGVTWNYTRKGIFNWKEKKSESYRDAIHSFFEHRRFLKLLNEWILFFVKDDELQKTVLMQHQTRAVEKVVERFAEPAKKRGLIWHTQGSGKTFTLITAARLILEDKARFPGATVMLVVDRNELEGQLSGWVERIVGEMQASDIAIEYATTRARLQELLDQDFRGLIISMIHKFDGIRKNSSARDDFIVLIDEAHRSVGGDLGNYLMGALPNATLIGFTGTPIDKTAYGKGTFKVFGTDDERGYLDKYSIRESIDDGTTLRLKHSVVPGELSLPADLLEREFLSLTEAEGVSDIDDLNRILDRAVTLKAFLKSDERVEGVARFVANHFRENVEPLGYKAFLVAVDREACALYKRALDRHLPPEYSTAIYTENSADVVDRPLVAELQLGMAEEKTARKAFPKPDKLPKIFIVTDKLLTGFDAPILYCMYLDKPMRDHVLLQAIARVNRPYEDAAGVEKPCGLIVDFVGVLRELKKALAFDSDDVSGVIEDLDLLFARFTELMDGPGREYLKPMGGNVASDAALEKLLYQTFLTKEKRQEFAEFYKEVEGLYEILSPSSRLRDYIDPYNRLAELYVLLRNTYGKQAFLYSDIAHKTERLVRENTTDIGAYALRKTVEFDVAALEALQERGGSDAGKVVNLVRRLASDADARGNHEQYLLGIAERAGAVLNALEERQLSTQQALDEIALILAEKEAAEQVRRDSGMDADTFAVYWVLRKELPDDATAIAREISELFQRFPAASTNSDEYRQLKAEIYKVLLRFVSGHRMVDLADEIMGVPRQ
jgi:type I restriction enzyme R subunit